MKNQQWLSLVQLVFWICSSVGAGASSGSVVAWGRNDWGQTNVPASAQCTYTVQVKGITEGSGSSTTGFVTSTNAPQSANAGAMLSVFVPPTLSSSFGGFPSGKVLSSGARDL